MNGLGKVFFPTGTDKLFLFIFIKGTRIGKVLFIFLKNIYILLGNGEVIWKQFQIGLN